MTTAAATSVERWMIEAEIRAASLDETKRTATFVAATEGGVMGYSGREYLRVAGVQLKRYKKNPVILDTHDRFQASAIVGRAIETKVEERELLVTIEFAKTERAEEIWQLVLGGFLRTVSVGFMPDRASTLNLAEGQTDGAGDAKIVGPARIYKKWELLEISVVPVPADPDAVRRSLQWEKGEEMSAPNTTAAPAAQQQSQVSAPAPAISAAPAVPATPVRDEVADLRAAQAEARRREILAYTPAGMEAFAQGLIVDATVTPEIARQRLLSEYTRQHPPVGTPAPAPVVPTASAIPTASVQMAQQAAPSGTPAVPAESVPSPDDGLLIRSLTNPRIF